MPANVTTPIHLSCGTPALDDRAGGGQAAAGAAGRPLHADPWFWAAMLLQVVPIARFLFCVLGDPYAYVDDAGTHLPWVWRLLEPTRLKGDFITDYFASQTPAGVDALFRLSAVFVSPLVFNKILPVLLGAASAWLMFAVAVRLFRSSRAAFWATLVFVLHLWTTDDLGTGISRSFFHPALLLMLWSALAGRHLVSILTIAVSAVLYAPAALFNVVVLAFLSAPGRLSDIRLGSRDLRRRLLLPAAGACVLAAILLPGQFSPGAYGPVISAHEARRHPAFNPGGRQPFFGMNPVNRFLIMKEPGLGLASAHPLTVLPALIVPFVARRWRSATPSLRWWPTAAPWLGRIVLAAVITFLAAHLLLFRLYAPGRYLGFPLPVVGALGSGLVIAAWTERIVRPLGSARRRLILTIACTTLLAAHVPLWPMGRKGMAHHAIVDYLRREPPSTHLASTPQESEFLPLLTGLPVVASAEHAAPFHPRFYGEMDRRIRETLEAFYTDSPAVVAAFARRYHVELFVVPLYRASPDQAGMLPEPFGRLASERSEARLRTGPPPLLFELARQQSVVRDVVRVRGRDKEVAIVPAAAVYTRAGLR